MPNPLILDTDGGVDDAQALLLLVAHGRAPDLITTLFGNVALEAATANILATLAVLGLNIPVHMGAARPLVQPVIDARHIHGQDGLGGATRPAHALTPAPGDAVTVLREALRNAAAQGGKIDILTLGPLTNLALALRAEPTIVTGIGQLTVMGGTSRGRGNTTPAAEFNIYADPEAADIVFGEALSTLIVPWEPCVDSAISGAEVDAMFMALPAGPVRDFSRALADHVRQGSIGRSGIDRVILPDPLAAAVIIDPGTITTTTAASVQVALAPGLTRGMTVIDPSGRLGTPSLTVVEAVDTAKLAALYAASLAPGTRG